MIQSYLRDTWKLTLPLQPQVFLFHQLRPPELSHTEHSAVPTLIHVVLLVALRCLFTAWLSTSSPTLSMVIQQMKLFCNVDRLDTERHKNTKTQKFFDKWKHIIVNHYMTSILKTLMANESAFFEFVLVGFPGLPEKHHIVFGILIFLIYYLSLCANLTVILLAFYKEHLHQPMYIIIASLAFSDLLFDTSTFTPLIFHTLNPLDSFIIMFMAIDRYVAICKPLQYHAIIGNRLTVFVCIALCMIAVVIGLGIMILAYALPYSGSNKIKNCFCSIGTVGVTTYMDPAPTLLKAYYIGLVCHLGPLSFIIFSYTIIITKVCSSAQSNSGNKAVYTCVTHWFIIRTYYVPRLLVYTYEQTQKPQVDVYVSLIFLYTFVPHSSSPIIFCLRNEEIKRTLRSSFKGIKNIDMDSSQTQRQWHKTQDTSSMTRFRSCDLSSDA
ncbi:olfactory receptor 7A17-like [Hyla sarda]|uniref:olfactory receptor 7A17-like n=1 Tax=Hyla sarda TaxID=327740 RepID=UPI0024C461BB|nr:olfactory receptor 7A17-like [Hyla sarda]